MQIEAEASSVLSAFSNAARRVPAYAALLRESGLQVEDIQSLEDFRKLPVLQKSNTFKRFPIEELCLDGTLGQLATVLTSSGHSGVFGFGLTDRDSVGATVKWVDDSLDYLFSVRSRPTLLINCLPMGVKIQTQACTLAETSVRPDMALGLITAFGRHFRQIILVGDAAFVKLLLENASVAGVDWRKNIVHVILGEETLAENARQYFGGFLGHDPERPDNGMIISSMGIAELGLHLFFEVPPVAALVALRRLLHGNRDLRELVFGPATWVPSVFTYDPRRIFVEFDADDRLIITTLDKSLRIPLIRYAPGDKGTTFKLRPEAEHQLKRRGWALPETIPVIAVRGRDDFAVAGTRRLYPEAVKEGIYRDAVVAAATTANFRLVSGTDTALIRIQLAPRVEPTEELAQKFRAAISHYVDAPHHVRCEPYETFGSGMALDYERKFQYLGA